jgi:hypothetical protein
VGIEHLPRQDVEQVLGKTPDRRRVPEQLMRVQIQRAVIAVAEIEVPVQHQHLVPLQFGQCLRANVVPTCHS